VRRAAGAEPVETTVACPSEWDSSRQAALASAVSQAGLSGVQVVGEAVAAAAALGDRLPSGGTVLVVDAGASSCDVGLVRRTDDGYEQLGFETLDGTGGIRLDTCLAELAGAWIAAHDRGVRHRLEDPLTAVDRAARLLLWEELRALKERLSFEESASFTVPLADTELTVTRTEFEALAQPILARVARTAAGMGGATTLLLVGGGSRIPLLWSLVEAATGLAAVTVKEPELAVAEGCALLPRDFTAGDAGVAATIPGAAAVGGSGGLGAVRGGRRRAGVVRAAPAAAGADRDGAQRGSAAGRLVREPAARRDQPVRRPVLGGRPGQH
jgi:molecular chaperone DnaK (HSP70)